MSNAAISIPVRVYIEDTDAGGIVYYVNYLKYFERARTELMRAAGFAKAALPDAGAMFVVHAMQVEYHRPAVLDDALTVSARVATLGRARLVFAQEVRRDEALLCSAEVTVACVDPATRKPCALPAAVRESLKQQER